MYLLFVNREMGNGLTAYVPEGTGRQRRSPRKWCLGRISVTTVAYLFSCWPDYSFTYPLASSFSSAMLPIETSVGINPVDQGAMRAAFLFSSFFSLHLLPLSYKHVGPPCLHLKGGPPSGPVVAMNILNPCSATPLCPRTILPSIRRLCTSQGFLCHRAVARIVNAVDMCPGLPSCPSMLESTVVS